MSARVYVIPISPRCSYGLPARRSRAAGTSRRSRRSRGTHTPTTPPFATPSRGWPAQLDHVDALVAGGTIGGERPNAADFQILAGVRVLCEFEELAHLVEGRPCEAAARRLFPDWTGPVPRGLPALS